MTVKFSNGESATLQDVLQPVEDDTRGHGSPYDRGSADSHYGRPYAPHYWPNGTYKGYPVPYEDMSTAQVKEYYTGYNDNEELGHFKDWGE